MIRTILILFLFLPVFSISAQKLGDTLTIKLERYKGPGPFFQSFGSFNELLTDPTQRFYGLRATFGNDLPSEFNDFKLGVLDTDFPQMAYSAIKRGVLDSANYYNGWFGLKNSDQLKRLTAQYVDTEVALAYGTIGNDRILIVDTDNDESFIDEKPIKLKSSIINEETFLNPPLYSAQIEKYKQGEIVNDTVSFTFLEYIGRIMLNISEYRYGSAIIEGKPIHIYMNTSFYSIQYKPEYLKFLVLDEKFNNTFDEVEENRDKTLEINEIFNLSEFGYQPVSINYDGTELKLVRVSKKDESIGIGFGQIAPKLEGWTLKDSLYRMDSDSKIKLLDFWGTWCAPCIAEIPYLKDAYKIFRSEGLEIVSVAKDEKANVEGFVKKNGIKWKQIMEQDAKDVLKDFKVNSYPTTFLLSSENKIIDSQFNLRGMILIPTLLERFKLNPNIAQGRISEGNSLIKLKADNLAYAVIKADFTNQMRMPFYNFFGAEKAWERGFNLNPGSYSVEIEYALLNDQETKVIQREIIVNNSANQVIEIILSQD